jgi:very-short-patch-repair endonuclease/transcription elongation GreA/GreB family factor
MSQVTSPAHDERLAGRALRLVEFLISLQEMRTRPVRSLDSYPRVLWLHDAPADDARVAAAWSGDLERKEGLWLSVDRVEREDPPHPPPLVEPWVPHPDLFDSSLDAPRLRASASLREQIISADGDRVSGWREASLEEHPEVRSAYEAWLPAWLAWAARDQAQAAARALYQRLYALYQESRGQSETFEVILGLGLLTSTSGGQPVKRHLVTARATIDLDLDTGRLTVGPDPEASIPSLEQDMLDHEDRVRTDVRDRIHDLLEDAVGQLWSTEGVVRALHAWVNAAGVGVAFDPGLAPQAVRDQARVTFAPALILRQRGEKSFLNALNRIKETITATGEVPEGLAQLLTSTTPDSDDETRAAWNQAFGDGETYFPLPANEQQLQIVDRLRRHRTAVVQGPPGTGKTHTIANLVTDLLAHGQRVLITSHAARALKVLKDKLPEGIADLCVSVTEGATRRQEDLERSVATILDRTSRDDVAGLDAEHDQLVARLERAREAKATAQQRLREIRLQETQHFSPYVGRYSGTPQQVAEQLAQDEPRLGWMGEVDPRADKLSNAEAIGLLRLLRTVDGEVRAAALPAPDLAALPTPEEFGSLARRRAELRGKVSEASLDQASHHVDALRAAPSDVLDRLGQALDSYAEALHALAQRREPWLPSALVDLVAGRGQVLEQTYHHTVAPLEALGPHLHVVRGHQVSGIEQLDPGRAATRLLALKQHLDAGRPLRRLGVRAKPFKDAAAEVAAIRVDGAECATSESVNVAYAHCMAESLLRQLERTWSLASHAGPLGVRVAHVQAERDALRQLLELRPRLDEVLASVRQVSLPRQPGWSGLDEVDQLRRALDHVRLDRLAAELEATVHPATSALRGVTLRGSYSPSVDHALAAIERWDPGAYAEARRGLEAAIDATRRVNELERLTEKLRASCPTAYDDLLASHDDAVWAERVASIEDAYGWAEWESWLAGIADPAEEDRWRRKLDEAERAAKETLNRIAVNRGWRFCQSRMTHEEQLNLKIYATAIKKIGKGTGKYAVRHREDARKALANAQTAIPAWIMPLYSVVDSVPFDRPNIFDVVIIDEASQSGHEALLLFWLARKVLVVGDEEQISPESVGLDFDRIFRLQDELLLELPGKSLFGPTNSFLDHAYALADSPIMLREHFRCMPEIIGFSNRLSYHRRLIPVRQYGADRLSPLRLTLLRDAFVTGSSSRTVNPAEAEEVVETIEKCCVDPTYDGKSMGVITLLGSDQARSITEMLIERIGPEEMERRRLHVDKPEAFQGDERDVVFMSMVASPIAEDGQRRRLGALSKRGDQQRLNVAASRARDQVWMFHSVLPEELPSTDYRREYLLYLRTQPIEQDELGLGEVLPDVRHSEFDSLFEQRVFLDLRERGFRVRPQYPVGRYRIDLVVEGGTRRLAVECDGDEFHGPEHEHDDALRQRDLERLGWSFWRVRGSQFFRDPEKALESLWQLLDRMGIVPEPATPADDTVTEVLVEAVVPADIEVAHEPVRAEALPVAPVAVTAPVPDKAIGQAAMARLEQEAAEVRARLTAGADVSGAADGRAARAERRSWEREQERLERRLNHLEDLLVTTQVVDGLVQDRVTPGGRIRIRDQADNEVSEVVVSVVDCHDGLEAVSPYSSLGEMLETAQVGEVLEYDTPHGRRRAVEVLTVAD